jgi:hypothetical protein
MRAAIGVKVVGPTLTIVHVRVFVITDSLASRGELQCLLGSSVNCPLVVRGLIGTIASRGHVVCSRYLVLYI